MFPIYLLRPVTGYISDIVIDEMQLLTSIIGINCLIAIACYMAIGAVIIFRHFTSFSIDLYQPIVSTYPDFLKFITSYKFVAKNTIGGLLDQISAYLIESVSSPYNNVVKFFGFDNVILLYYQPLPHPLLFFLRIFFVF